MKIAFFSDCYLDLIGGIVTTINVEKAELERRGHTVYVFSSSYPHDKKEITKFYSQVKQDGLSIVPLSVYFLKGRAKVEIGLCKGKKLYDKRAVAAQKDAKRKLRRRILFFSFD